MNHMIKNEYLNLTVSTKGGEMQSIKTSDGTEYLWQGDCNTWSDHSPNLFPYIGRLNDKTYQYQGEKYSLDIHGFLPYTEMELLRQTQSQLTLRLTDNEALRNIYPFHFELLLHYQIEKNKIRITYEIHNQDEKSMYFGIGGHPGFNVPLEKNLHFEDYILEFSSPCEPYQVTFSKKCFVTGENAPYSLEDRTTLPLSHDMFDEDAIVLHDTAKEITLKSKKGTKSVKVSFPEMKYIGFWHWPKTAVNYVCIEPWSSLPAREDVIEDLEIQENLICLEAGKIYTNTWIIEIF